MKRIVNISQAGISYAAALTVRKPVMLGYPVSAGIELTNRCNLRCPQCPTGKGSLKVKGGFMQPDLFNLVNEQLAPYLSVSMFYLRGEPFLHNHLFDYIEKWCGKGIIISTNGHFLTDDNVNQISGSAIRKLIVSLDGMSQAVYSKYRVGGDVNIVKEGIRRLMSRIRSSGRGPSVEIQFLASGYNEHEMEDVRAFAASVGASFRVKTMQLLEPGNSGEWLPENNSLSRYKDLNGNVVIKGRLSDRCLRLWTTPVITWDGKVLPCCFDKDEEFVIGNIRANSFREIWFGDKAREMRISVLKKRSAIKICRNCTSGI